MPLFDVHNHLGVELGAYFRGEFPYGQSLVGLLEEAERCGVSHLVVFPMVSYLALPNFGASLAHSEERTPYAWENRRMMEEIYGLFAARSARVFPFVMFDPAREVEAQIAELRRLKSEFALYGLKTQPTIIQSKITTLNDVGEPFLELASEWDLPLLIHSSILPADIYSQASDIIDIAQRWPQLRFNVAHSCRFDKPCLDRIASLENCWFDVSAHGIHCELASQNNPIVAVPERRFASNYECPATVLRDLGETYPEKMLWGSDSPYYSFAARVEGQNLELLSSFERETGFFHALPEETKIRAGWKNALDWLGVKQVV